MRVGMIPENPLEWLLSKGNAIPFPVADAFVAMLQSRAIMAATRLGVFAALSKEPSDSRSLAARLSCDERGLHSLLEALVNCHYLREINGKFELSPSIVKWLSPDEPQSVNWFLEFNFDNWELMSHLEESIRTGKSFDLHSKLTDVDQWRRYMRGLHDLSKIAAKEMVMRCSIGGSPKRLLDIAGGHGGYSAAFCRKYRQLRATIFDLPQVTDIGTEIVKDYYGDVADRIEFTQGDLRADSLGSGYDVILLLNAIHHFDSDQVQRSFKEIFNALTPGGTFIILDQLKAAGASTSYLGSLAQLLFLVMTNGTSYDLQQVTAWLEKTGFSNVRCKKMWTGPGASFVIAQKK